jgi:hypothetical protein
VIPTESVAAWRLEVPIEKGGREPKLTSGAELTARFIANRRGCADLSLRSRVRGKTSTSLAVAQLLTQRADSRILITDVDSPRSAEEWGASAQAYIPIVIDCPPSLGYPAGGPVWEEALRALGLDADDDHTQ